MAENRMSQQPSFTFKDFIPPDLYRRYFDVMLANETVYVCVIQNEDQISTVYLERPRPQDANIDGLIRVFFDINHLKRYLNQVSLLEGIHPQLVKRWELKFTEFLEYLKTMDDRRKEAKRLGVVAIACSIYAEKLLDLDTIWTSEPNFMV